MYYSLLNILPTLVPTQCLRETVKVRYAVMAALHWSLGLQCETCGVSLVKAGTFSKWVKYVVISQRKLITNIRQGC